MLDYMKTIIEGLKTFFAGELGKLERLMKKEVNSVGDAAEGAHSAAADAKGKATNAQNDATYAISLANSALTSATRATPVIFTNVYDESNPLIDWDGDPTDKVSTNTFVKDDYNHTYYKLANFSTDIVQRAYDRFGDIYRTTMSYGTESNLGGDSNIAVSGNCKWTTYVMVATEAGTYSLTYGYSTFTLEVPEAGVYVCIRQNDTYTFHTKKVVVPTYNLEVQANFQNINGNYRTLRFYGV